MFEMLENYGCWAWSWLSEFESRKCEFKIVYPIIVIFDMKHEFKVMSDHFKSIYGNLL